MKRERTPLQRQSGWRLARSLTLVLLLGAAGAQNTAPNTQPAPASPAAGQPPKDQAPASGESPASPAASGDASLPQVSISIERKTKSGETRTIKIVRVGTDETGISANCVPRDEDPEGTPTVVVYSDTTPRGVEVTVDKNLIRAPLAIVTKKSGGDGHIEMSAGTARYLDDPPPGKTDRLSLCAVEATPVVKNGTVDATQGKTRLKGSKLVYDESDGIARIEGPISFTREKLTGSSERIEMDIEKQTTTLVGAVQFRDGNRTSKAARVDYDDTKNVAILRGTPQRPAETSTPSDTLRAETIRYNLDTGEAVVIRGDKPITGTFDDGEADGEGAPATPPTTPAASPAPAPTTPPGTGSSGAPAGP